MKKIIIGSEMLDASQIPKCGIVIAESEQFSWLIGRNETTHMLEWFTLDESRTVYASHVSTIEELIKGHAYYKWYFFDTFIEFCEYWLKQHPVK